MQLIEVISELNRGVSADIIDKERVEELAQGLEKINPTKTPLKSPLINGQWELIYTTSDGILGTKKPPIFRPRGPIYQLIGKPALVYHHKLKIHKFYATVLGRHSLRNSVQMTGARHCIYYFLFKTFEKKIPAR